MRTYRFGPFHVDKDYGASGLWYFEDNFFYSHGYAPTLRAAVLEWVVRIPASLKIRRTLADVDRKSQEEEKKSAGR